MSKNQSDFWAGARAVLPIQVGDLPFGMIYAVLARTAGLNGIASQAMSSIIFAGSAQFLAVKLFQEAAPGLVIVLTIATVNLRHMLYSASLAPYLKHLSMRWKLLLSYLLTDEAYAVTITHFGKEGATPSAHWYFLGAGLSLWITWQISTALGILVGATLPADWPLDFALPVTFIAIIVPAIRGRPAIAAALSAGGAALLFFGLPYKLGLLLAALIGIGLGTILEVHR